MSTKKYAHSIIGKLFVLLGLILLVLANQAYAASVTVTINWPQAASSGAPIVGARVELYSAAGSFSTSTTRCKQECRL